MTHAQVFLAIMLGGGVVSLLLSAVLCMIPKDETQILNVLLFYGMLIVLLFVTFIIGYTYCDSVGGC